MGVTARTVEMAARPLYGRLEGPPILSAEAVRKSFGGSTVLDVEHVAVPSGGTLAVLGPSGSGKSTLLSILGLLLKPDSGRIVLRGEEVRCGDRRAQLSIAAVFQKPYLFKGSVGHNVDYGLRLRRLPAKERRRRASGALERVGLAGWEDRSAATLSGGEAQRVALARALVLEPEVLLLDEPLSSLDPVLKGRLTDDFASILRSSRLSTLYVTHDQDEAMAVADRVAILREGRLAAYGDVDEVMGLPADEWTARFLGMEAPLPGVVVGSEDGLARIAAPGGAEIFAVSDAAPGKAVAFAVRPEDVLLFEATERLPLSSARNRLRAVVEALLPRGSTYRVTLRVGGISFAASVSRAAKEDLGLAPGVEVLALVKATAILVREQGSGDERE